MIIETQGMRLLEAEPKVRSEAEHYTERIARLQMVSAALGDTLTQADAARVTVEQSVLAMGATVGLVTLLILGRRELEMLAQTGYDERFVERWRRFPLESDTPAHDVIETGKPLFFVSAEDLARRYPRFAASHHSFTSGAWASLPLVVRGTAMGMLGLGFAAPRDFSAVDTGFMLMLSQQCAQALDRARLYEREHRGRVAAEEAHRRLSQVLQAVPEPVLIADLERREFVLCNRAFEAAAGIDVTGLEVRTTDPHFLSPHTPDGKLLLSRDMPTQRALYRGETVLGMELVLRHYTEQRDVWLRANSAPLRTADGKIYGAVTAFQDISRIKELERQKTAALAAISHDLMNPLASVSLRAQLLKREASKVGPESQRLLAGIDELKESVRKTIRQAEELQDVLAMHYGQALHLRRKVIDLVSLVRDIARDEEVETSRIQVEGTASEIQGNWDEVRLGRVFANLLNNALKYSSPDSKILVRISAECSGDDSWAVVRVEDQGIGFPAADRLRLFEPFYRASNVSPDTKGSGLGLAGAYQIVQQHGGTMSVESEAGMGSIVTVRLPSIPAS